MQYNDMTRSEKERWEERKSICMVDGNLDCNSAENIAYEQIENDRKSPKRLSYENKTLKDAIENLENDLNVLSSFLCIVDENPDIQVSAAYDILDQILMKFNSECGDLLKGEIEQ